MLNLQLQYSILECGALNARPGAGFGSDTEVTAGTQLAGRTTANCYPHPSALVRLEQGDGFGYPLPAIYHEPIVCQYMALASREQNRWSWEGELLCSGLTLVLVLPVSFSAIQTCYPCFPFRINTYWFFMRLPSTIDRRHLVIDLTVTTDKRGQPQDVTLPWIMPLCDIKEL